MIADPVLFVTSYYMGMVFVLNPLYRADCHTYLTGFLRVVLSIFLFYSLLVYWRCAFGDPGYISAKLV